MRSKMESTELSAVITQQERSEQPRREAIGRVKSSRGQKRGHDGRGGVDEPAAKRRKPDKFMQGLSHILSSAECAQWVEQKDGVVRIRDVEALTNEFQPFRTRGGKPECVPRFPSPSPWSALHSRLLGIWNRKIEE